MYVYKSSGWSRYIKNSVNYNTISIFVPNLQCWFHVQIHNQCAIVQMAHYSLVFSEVGLMPTSMQPKAWTIPSLFYITYLLCLLLTSSSCKLSLTAGTQNTAVAASHVLFVKWLCSDTVNQSVGVSTQILLFEKKHGSLQSLARYRIKKTWT